jgi:hypothetical protein
MLSSAKYVTIILNPRSLRAVTTLCLTTVFDHEDHGSMIVHMYLDLHGIEHRQGHNTNATQMFLIANLPGEIREGVEGNVGSTLLKAVNSSENSKTSYTFHD